MSVSNAQRHDLHSGLEEVLGPQRAETLMDYLPPVGWADVATKSDLDAAVATLSTTIDTDIGRLATRIDTDIHRLDAKIDVGLAALSAKIDLETANRRIDIERLEKSMEVLKNSIMREQRVHLVVMVTVLSAMTALVNLFG